MPRPVILIGLSGAGKSTVARLAAAELGAPWWDLDQVIASEAGVPIARLFAERGEEAFRELERRAMARILAGPPSVIAAGGGWAAQPGNLDRAEPGAYTLYLSLPPEVAARRLGAASDRPLLAGDPLPRLREQLAARGPWYDRAGMEIDASAAPEQVATAVINAARRHAGW